MLEQQSAELSELDRGIQQCTHCPLHKSRTHAVPGEGNPQARVMSIGEAPGETEDEQGRPFVGPAGRFLNVLLKQAGLQRNAVFITNSVKCRPPTNRFPHVEELKTCKTLWLDRQLALIKPQIVILLGKASLKQMLGEIGPLQQLHGQERRHNSRSYFIHYHPAAGLRSPAIRSIMEQDFLALKNLLQVVHKEA